MLKKTPGFPNSLSKIVTQQISSKHNSSKKDHEVVLEEKEPKKENEKTSENVVPNNINKDPVVKVPTKKEKKKQ